VRLTRWDVLVLGLALAGLAALYALRGAAGPGAWVEVAVEAEVVARLPLDRDTRLTVQGVQGPAVIEVRDGRVRFVRSTCKTRYCVKSGWHSHRGEVAACLPNRVSLNITGEAAPWDAVNH